MSLFWGNFVGLLCRSQRDHSPPDVHRRSRPKPKAQKELSQLVEELAPLRARYQQEGAAGEGGRAGGWEGGVGTTNRFSFYTLSVLLPAFFTISVAWAPKLPLLEGLEVPFCAVKSEYILNLWCMLLGGKDFNFLPTNWFSINPLKVKLLAGEQKATEECMGFWLIYLACCSVLDSDPVDSRSVGNSV